MFSNNYQHSSRNVQIFAILFAFVLVLVFMLIYYSDQFSTSKQAIIILILIGYVYIICRNAENIFHGYSSKTYKLSDLNNDNNDESFYSPQKDQDKGVSQFIKQLRNINSEMEMTKREKEMRSQRSLIQKNYQSYYKSHKSQQRFTGSFSLNSSRQFNNEYSSKNFQHYSIIQEIKNRITKDNGVNYKKLRKDPSLSNKYFPTLSQQNESVFNSLGVCFDKIDPCLQIVQDYLNDSLEGVLIRYNNNYKELAKIIGKCFGLKLTIYEQSQRSERQSISLNEVQILIQKIKRQKILPRGFKCLIKGQELPSYVSSIQVTLSRIPNLMGQNNQLALEIYSQILSNQFSSQSIKIIEDKISVFIYQGNSNTNYFVKHRDGTLGYTKFSDFRTRYAKQIVLLYLLKVSKSEYKCQKRVIKQLKNCLSKPTISEMQSSSPKKKSIF